MIEQFKKKVFKLFELFKDGFVDQGGGLLQISRENLNKIQIRWVV